MLFQDFYKPVVFCKSLQAPIGSNGGSDVRLDMGSDVRSDVGSDVGSLWTLGNIMSDKFELKI